MVLFTNIMESTQYLDINLPIQNICEKQENRFRALLFVLYIVLA